MGGVAGHNQKLRPHRSQLLSGFRHSGNRVRPAGQNSRRAVWDLGVVIDIDAQMVVVALRVRHLHNFREKVGCGQRPHAAQNTKRFFHGKFILLSNGA
jgi:hypothetical protein